MSTAVLALRQIGPSINKIIKVWSNQCLSSSTSVHRNLLPENVRSHELVLDHKTVRGPHIPGSFFFFDCPTMARERCGRSRSGHWTIKRKKKKRFSGPFLCDGPAASRKSVSLSLLFSQTGQSVSVLLDYGQSVKKRKRKEISSLILLSFLSDRPINKSFNSFGLSEKRIKRIGTYTRLRSFPTIW
jgi:hypothetical protein